MQEGAPAWRCCISITLTRWRSRRPGLTPVIAQLVAPFLQRGELCADGSRELDLAVIEADALTCTPEVLMRAIANVNEAGAQSGPRSAASAASANLIIELQQDAHRLSLSNLPPGWSRNSLDESYQCHHMIVRQARAYMGTPARHDAAGTGAAVSRAFRFLESQRSMCSTSR